MLAFGFSSGLPFALLIGTLTAWLGEAKVDLDHDRPAVAGSGSPARSSSCGRPPSTGCGRPIDRAARAAQRDGSCTCQAVIIAALLGLVATDPAQSIGQFALFAFLGALALGDAGHRHRRVADRRGGRSRRRSRCCRRSISWASAPPRIVGGAFALHLAAGDELARGLCGDGGADGRGDADRARRARYADDRPTPPRSKPANSTRGHARHRAGRGRACAGPGRS